jgi:hypothetical protein
MSEKDNTITENPGKRFLKGESKDSFEITRITRSFLRDYNTTIIS